MVKIQVQYSEFKLAFPRASVGTVVRYSSQPDGNFLTVFFVNDILYIHQADSMPETFASDFPLAERVEAIFID